MGLNFARSNKTESENMKMLRMILLHHCNPLHIYCRLRDCGLGHDKAIMISGLYERSLHRILCH